MRLNYNDLLAAGIFNGTSTSQLECPVGKLWNCFGLFWIDFAAFSL